MEGSLELIEYLARCMWRSWKVLRELLLFACPDAAESGSEVDRRRPIAG